MATRTDSFDLPSGRKIGRRYVIESMLGTGSEGEVYQIRELSTGIRRAAKIYYPHRDPKQRQSIRHAQKLNALRLCPVVLHYHHSDVVNIRGREAVVLISELCEGAPLGQWITRQPGKRLRPYAALHVLYNLVRGLEAIHAHGEYHSDVHTENILIQPRGVRFDLKLIDFFDWGRPTREKQRTDICQAVKVFYDCLGGRDHYAQQPAEIRHICAAQRDSLIIERFPTINALRHHLEIFEWATLG